MALAVLPIVRSIDPEHRDQLQNMLFGTLNEPPIADNDKKTVTAERFKNMSESDKVDLYNSIVTTYLGETYRYVPESNK